MGPRIVLESLLPFIEARFALNHHQDFFKCDHYSSSPRLINNKVFRYVETLFTQGRILFQNLFTIYIVKEINACLLTKFLCFEKEFYLRQIHFLHVEMPYGMMAVLRLTMMILKKMNPEKMCSLCTVRFICNDCRDFESKLFLDPSIMFRYCNVVNFVYTFG